MDREVTSDVDEGIAPSIGQRLREIRLWRGLSLRAAAGLAGFSASYLSMIENGKSPVDKRSTLEAFASALRVAPSELTGGSPAVGRRTDPEVASAVAAMADVEAAMTDVAFGEATVTARPWLDVACDVEHLNTRLRPAADYSAQMKVLPGLIRDLNVLVATETEHRRQVLGALMDAYQASAMATKYLGARGLPSIAAMHARRVAEQLDDPVWTGLATWIRSLTLGSGGRARMRELSLAAADDLQPHMRRREARELYGALHLNAALAAAALGETDTSRGHAVEAWAAAESMPETAGPGFGHLSFGRTNVQIWGVALAVELGEHGRVRELRDRVQPQLVASLNRQSSYWADLGRGLAAARATHDDAVAALAEAERLAPVKTRANPFVREAVTGLLRRARRDAAGRELRGMAFRMGIAG